MLIVRLSLGDYFIDICGILKRWKNIRMDLYFKQDNRLLFNPLIHSVQRLCIVVHEVHEQIV